MARPVKRVPPSTSGKEKAGPEVLSGEVSEAIANLEGELKAKALMLAELELTIEDYQREKARLLRELAFLKERLLDLSEERNRG